MFFFFAAANFLNSNFCFLLLCLVIYNERERVHDFIAKGKTMDRDNCNYTALHYAARNGNEEICKMLLNDGKADVNAVTNGGVTPLHRAAMMGEL